jgi:preprotein translocase subunit SecE
MVNKLVAAENTRFDGFKWGLVLLLIIAGVAGNFFYGTYPLVWRVLAELALAAVAAAVAFQTSKGKQAWDFIQEARMELRKVVWPTRQETIQITFVVTLMILAMSVILWGIDTVLLKLMAWLTGSGQGG